MEQTFMKEKKILPLVFSMSLPMVLSMLVNSLYNIVDSYFVAKVSEEAMTALSLIYPLQLIVTAVSVGMGIGMNALIAYYLGAEKKNMADKAASLGVGLNFCHGILLMMILLIGSPYFLRLFSNQTDTILLGQEYGVIVFAVTPIITLGISFEKLFQSVGRMKVSMICMSVGFISNILLDPLLIFGVGPFPEMGMKGAAMATATGQILTLIAYLLFYFLTKIPVSISWKHMRWDKDIIGRMYGIGVPAALNLALPSVLITALNAILAPFGAAYVLVLGAYYKLQTFIYLTVNGIIQGIRPIIGYNYGAGEYERVKKIFRTALGMAIVIMVIGMTLCLGIPEVLMGIFTGNQATIELGVQALRIISFGFVVSAISVTTSGALEGLGKGMPSLLISLSRFIFVMIIAAWTFSRIWGAAGVWFAFPVTEAITALLSIFLYHKYVRKI